jgi:hypothetical protein
MVFMGAKLELWFAWFEWLTLNVFDCPMEIKRIIPINQIKVRKRGVRKALFHGCVSKWETMGGFFLAANLELWFGWFEWLTLSVFDCAMEIKRIIPINQIKAPSRQ